MHVLSFRRDFACTVVDEKMLILLLHNLLSTSWNEGLRKTGNLVHVLSF